jgi:hypothetical protein
MGIIEDIINNEFGLLLAITFIVWGGFLSFLTYIFFKIQSLKNDLHSLKQLDIIDD